MPDSLVRPAGADPRLEPLIVAASALITELSLDGVLQRVVQVAADVIGAHYAAIGVLAPDGRVLESFTTHGITDEVRARIGPLPRGHGILGLVIRKPRPIRLPDLAAHPDSYGFPPHHPPMHSFLGVPIVGRRGVFGNLYLTEKIGAETFSEADEHMAVVLAAITASAVENARLHEESAQLLEEVQTLHRTRERFFAMVNHELRNALAAVFGWAEMLVRKKDPATVPRAAFEVLDSARQAIGLINDLLDLSRLDEDRLKPVIRSVEPAAVCRRAIGRVTPAAEARRIRFDLHESARSADLRDRRQPAGADPRQPAPQRDPACPGSLRDPAGHQRTRPHGRVHRRRRGARHPRGRDRADLRRLRHQGGRREPGRRPRPPPVSTSGTALRGELRAVSRPGQGGRFVLELPATPDS